MNWNIFKTNNVTEFPKKVTDCNKFAKLLTIALPHGNGIIIDYNWEIIQTDTTTYHINGVHPVAGRFDKILTKIVLH